MRIEDTDDTANTGDTAAAEPPVVVRDGVLHVRVAAPGSGSVLDGHAMDDGAAALESLDSSVGAILLVGGADNFCGGGDVGAFHAAPERGAFVHRLAERFHRFVRALASAPVPVVAGVPGWAAGAGMSLVCHTDIAIGGRSTKLRPAYPALGFTPDGGLTWALPRIVGVRRARDILLTDAVLGSDEANRLGLLTRLVGDEVIVSEAERLARTLAAGPTGTVRRTKELLLTSAGASLDEQLDAETAAITASADSPDGIEGVNAFVEKRRPSFGR
ncbi:enoyl-CoA hydratase/isomerase family protein [Rhodococcoides corynebacterioides]|uniref:enoyl-CoA hydratase/isomerase family protein n=1 Tax=Rhodococcoides corynebacterioides TaxID=53972 RepID=UPI001C9A42B1|nr:enoyl-CoA hydratase-related protein [Rhodococcus corynebacterioides]MBY6350149.1 enoyl-CoA hydratase/isomerase family protein [Rhodococcus corynebacterioides]MBY6362262.1 enoyl-CoA hydratase/isomerase family protein [Rhodococcus corynebacterioides]